MMERWLSAFFQLSVFAFGIASCYLPISRRLRMSWKKILGLWIAILIPYFLIGSTLYAQFSLPMLFIELPALLGFFFVYWSTIKIDLSRALAIYVGTAAVELFTFPFSCMVDAKLNPDLSAFNLSWQGALVQPICSGLLFLGFSYPAYHYFSSVVDLLNAPKVWFSTVIISLIFFLLNLIVVPYSFKTLFVARVYKIYVIVECAWLITLIAIYILYYYTASFVLKNSLLKEKTQLLEMESKQAQKLQEYIRQTTKLRHDFRHSVRLLSTLAKEEDLVALKEHLAAYETQLEMPSPAQYCQNVALNALFGYYEQMAKEANIRCTWKIALPDPLPFSELDLASLFGNLIENAIHGCEELPDNERYFFLTTEIPHPGELYIVSTNSFNGVIHKIGLKYHSTKSKGLGIGLNSMEATVEKYKGHIKITHDHKEFDVDIFLPY